MRIQIFLATIFLICLSVFLYSRTLPHYYDEAAFNTTTDALWEAYVAHAGPKHDSEKYSQLNKEYKKAFERYSTPRTLLKKYNLTGMIVSFGLLLLFIKGIENLKTPPNKWLILAIGILATLIGFFALIQDGNEVYGRGELAPWHDFSPAYTGGILITSLISFIFVVLHAIALFGTRYSQQVTIFPLNIKQMNPFLALELLLFVAYTLWAMSGGGSYFALMTTPLWLYFYLSLFAIRANTYPTHEKLLT